MTLRVATILIALLALLRLAVGQGEVTIRAGDTLSVSCAEEASFNAEHRVSADGTIRLPAIGLVSVAGLTETGASERVTAAVRSKGWVGATLTVRLLAAAMEPISYSGAVELGGILTFRQGIRLSEVLHWAKPTSGADLARISITGRSGEVQVVDTTRPASDGGEDPLLKPGDRVFVPPLSRAHEVYLLGAVAQPGSVPFVRGMTARATIVTYGGTTLQANVSRARVVKSNGEEWPLDLGPFGRDIDLEPGDKIYVPVVDRQRFVSVVGAVANPGAVDYSPNMTIAMAVASAGGALPEANLDGVRVRRVAGKGGVPSVLQPFDIVDVPFTGPAPNRLVRAAMNLLGILLVFGR